MCQSHLEDFRGRWAVSFAASPSAGGWVERFSPRQRGWIWIWGCLDSAASTVSFAIMGALEGKKPLRLGPPEQFDVHFKIGSSLCHSMFLCALNLQVFHVPFKWYAVDTDAVSDWFSFTDLDGFGPYALSCYAGISEFRSAPGATSEVDSRTNQSTGFYTSHCHTVFCIHTCGICILYM